jgi:asparagine synthase (glutamine-hydrolysing)
MCGIAGFISRSRKFDARQLLQVSKTLRHRGPDDEGFLFVTEGLDCKEVYSGEFGRPDFLPNPISFQEINGEDIIAGFLHRRLSIIAPENEGHQPMSDPERKIWLVFNGEIYNYLSLREELKLLGCTFKTRTDSEVLLQAYKIWGQHCLAKLDGMWSFIILDLTKNQVFASVDRSGIKPFYYHKNEKGFCFASEIKAFRDFGLDFHENPKTVSRFLAYGLSDESEETMFADIFRLQAGHFLCLDLQTEKISIQQYHQWEINEGYDFQPFVKEEERIHMIRTQLLEMIRLRLQADVPLGVCLSGGIDSSTIAGLTANSDRISKSKGIRKAFMAVLPEGSQGDESGWAKLMAQTAGFDFYTTQPTEADFISGFKDLIYTQDEPSPGLNAFSQYAVFKKVSEEGVRVTLDGQGADEIFAGYPRHHESNMAEGIKHFIFPWQSVDFAKEGFLNFIRSQLGSQKSFEILQRFKPEYSILNPAVFTLAGAKGNFYSSVNEGLAREYSHSSLPFLLKAADRNSMRWSVESRMPFADYAPLVQYLFDQPGSSKIQMGNTKYLLRKAAEPFVPQSILGRKDKVGFAAPNQKWLTALLKWKSGSDFAQSDFIDSKLFQVYQNKFLNAPERSDYQLIWRLMAYLEWKEIFFKSR